MSSVHTLWYRQPPATRTEALATRSNDTRYDQQGGMYARTLAFAAPAG